MATCNYINEPRASQYGTPFISSVSSWVSGESLIDNVIPGGSGVLQDFASAMPKRSITNSHLLFVMGALIL